MSRLSSSTLVVYTLVTGCSHVAPPAPQAPIAVTPSGTTFAASANEPTSELTTEPDKVLYALGVIVGRNIGKFEITAQELRIVQRGIHDAALREKTRVNLEEYGPKVNQLGRERSERQAAQQKELGLAYVARLAGEPDTQLFTSGLVLRTLKAGTRDAPKDSDEVTVNYRDPAGDAGDAAGVLSYCGKPKAGT